MSFNGSGTYSLPSGNPVVGGSSISSTWANTTLSDLATALTNALCKDGQSTPTANLRMGAYKHTNLGAGISDGDSVRFEQLFGQGAPTDLASGATTDIGLIRTNFLTITGTTTITSFGSNYNGPKMLRFTGALTLTHNATTLILPGAVNITTAANDTCIAVPKAVVSGVSDGWIVLAYQTAAGTSSGTTPIAQGGTGQITALAAFNALKQAATTSYQGTVQLATSVEAAAGTDTAKPLTPATLRGGLNTTGTAPVYGVRAWGVFNGAGTTLAAGGNVASITKNATGDYTITFTTAMPSADYSVQISAQPLAGNNQAFALVHWIVGSASAQAPTASAFRFSVTVPGTGAYDSAIISFQVMA